MDIRDLNLNLLLVLDTLFEEGTLTRAAQRLRLSQPTMSASLSKLRQALGDEFENSGEDEREEEHRHDLR